MSFFTRSTEDIQVIQIHTYILMHAEELMSSVYN